MDYERLLSQQAQQIKPSGIRRFFDLANQMGDVISLGGGEPDFKTPWPIRAAGIESLEKGRTWYTANAGLMELRQEIAAYLNRRFDLTYDPKSEVLVTVGGSEAIDMCIRAMINPGDEVLIFDPYFSAYATQVRLGGGVPVFVPCREADGWQPDMERAAQYLTPRTKALVINTPNNPTGVCYSRPTLEAVARFARKNDLLVVADDIYTSFCYSEPFLPVLTLPGMKERTVAINSFSKNFVMTGFRVGNIVAPEPIARAVKSINDSVVYSAPAPSQRAALHALRRRKELAAQIVPEFSARMAYGAQRIRELPGFTLSPAGGGIYLFPGVGPTGLTSAEACERILEEAHVLMLPGSAFGDAGEGYLRIACTVGLDKMEEAFGRMAQMPMLQGR